jgi:putative hydrolase of the HAD superfamily
MPHQKPHPSIFEAALGQLSIEAQDALYVGDRVDFDIAGAQGAGMRAVLIRSPYLEPTPEDGTADSIIDELPDLIPALESLDFRP